MAQGKTSVREEKIRKTEELRGLGINPYPNSYVLDWTLLDIKKKYDEKISAHEETQDFYRIGGRIILKRDMGGLTFMTIQDEDIRLQITFMKKNLGEKYKLLKYFDVGDIVGVYGNVFKTKLGELSLNVQEFDMLCKSLSELGEKYHSIQDIEIKYRNRSLDMIMNPESKGIIKKRFLITQKIREFMIKEGILEVETPITQISYGGAAAEPFVTHHNDLDMDLYLRVSPEQSLKRVIAGDMRAVFEINKNFRNESIDRTHNPEFTMLEAYIAYKDYEYCMDLLERLVEFVALEVFGTLDFEFKGEKVSFARPWRRLSVKEALKLAKGFDVDKMSDEELFSEAEKIGAELPKKSRGYALLALFEEFGEPLGVQPTHFVDYPAESTPLCKQHRKDSSLIERFESFVCGMELANAYSELNDGKRQRELFEEQLNFKEGGQEETWGDGLDEDFLAAIDLGIPPTGGIGLGIDRLCMVLLNQDSIRDIIYFPTMKPKEKEENIPQKKKETMLAVALVNKGAKMELWQELNTVAHLNAAFGAREGRKLFTQDLVSTKDKEDIRLNIQHAIMLKEVASSDMIRELVVQAKEKNLEFAQFTREMLETSDDKKVAKGTLEKLYKEIEFLGVLIYGKKKDVEALTKEFPLYA
ncbi:lysine--tRNA ligase [Candidatus Woesearchaeota archaeon]|nr:lysine--tRNA ligase [Candidatus Woesearchaeota archaeon]USN44074.1 MAG: lysine--tRNA ligase [Candidatus Woesearchaeota archaeon]